MEAILARYEPEEDRVARDLHKLIHEAECTKEEMYNAVMMIVRSQRLGTHQDKGQREREKRDEKLKRKAGCCFRLCCGCSGTTCGKFIMVALAISFFYNTMARIVLYFK